MQRELSTEPSYITAFEYCRQSLLLAVFTGWPYTLNLCRLRLPRPKLNVELFMRRIKHSELIHEKLDGWLS